MTLHSNKNIFPGSTESFYRSISLKRRTQRVAQQKAPPPSDTYATSDGPPAPKNSFAV